LHLRNWEIYESNDKAKLEGKVNKDKDVTDMDSRQIGFV